jgi:ATP-dependent Lhr-like helicase
VTRYNARPALTRCSPGSRRDQAWFAGAFEAPTAAQVVPGTRSARAVTRWWWRQPVSGKTLAAFLAALDRLMTEAPPRTGHDVAGCCT